ncbi:MAG: hypothetical protein J5994_01615 [Ruminococcus sp.]|nr:hypothetical protein [Ruminococcus sp.]
MRKPKGAFRVFFLFVVIVIIMPCAFIPAFKKGNDEEKKFLEKGKNYLENGVKVECTVNGVGGYGGKNSISVLYDDENGKLITAKAMTNKKVSRGETFTGYVMPGQPGEVYIPGGSSDDKVFKIILIVLLLVFYAAGWAAPIMYIKALRRYKLIKTKGIPVKGTLISQRRAENEMFVTIRFAAANGHEYQQEFHATHGTPFEGDMYDLLYYVKPNGKCIAELIDFKLV